MGTVRAFEKRDIEQVVDLNSRLFPGSAGLSVDRQKSIFSEVCFHNPWYDDKIHSLVVEETGGRIIGFLGVVPRRMIFKNRPIQVAVAQHLMVDRSTLASAQLLRALFTGPQELSLSDMSVDVSNRLWVKSGGATADVHSIYWRRLLRPCSAMMEFVRRKKIINCVGIAGMPFARFIDGGLVRIPHLIYRQKVPESIDRELDATTLLKNINELTSQVSLRPDYDLNSLSWLLKILDCERRFGSFQKILVLNRQGNVLGWCLYNLKIGGRSEVVQIGAKKNCMTAVLNHLFYHAWRHGSYEIRGRLDPKYMKEFTDASCWFYLGRNWMSIHSKNSDILNAIYKNDTFLSRLEGDLWFF
jgi:hypothetical protein